jgi:parallel beta-helix repeat protein
MRRHVLTTLCLLAAAAPAAQAQLPAALPAPCTAVAPALPGAAQRMVAALPAGGTGCLAAGVHTGGVTLRRPDVALRPVPGQRATLRGQLHVAAGADRVTVTGLTLDGANPDAKPSPLVNADDALFSSNDVSNARESCFVLGDKVWGVAHRTRITGNLVHDCGVPGTNMDHGIYVRQAEDTVIEGNVVRDNPDRGVQLFPNADRTLVRGNLLVGNGEGVIFSGDGTDVSEDNVVERNIITASRLRWDVESHWVARRGAGAGNVARANCLFGGRRGALQRPAIGFTAVRNVLADPRLVRRGTAYRLGAGSPCAVRPPVLTLPHG